MRASVLQKHQIFMQKSEEEEGKKYFSHFFYHHIFSQILKISLKLMAYATCNYFVRYIRTEQTMSTSFCSQV